MFIVIPDQYKKEAEDALAAAGFNKFDAGLGEGYEERKSPIFYRKEKIPDELRWLVWERDNFTCKNCGSRKDLQVDHIKPESKGGKTESKNLQTLCKNCNCKKGSKI